jgi:hypothetical protein
VPMWDRLLLAMDQYESGQTALAFTARFAAETGADSRGPRNGLVSRQRFVAPNQEVVSILLVRFEATTNVSAGLARDHRCQPAHCAVHSPPSFPVTTLRRFQVVRRGPARRSAWDASAKTASPTGSL